MGKRCLDFSAVKWSDGAHHRVSHEHLRRYVGEFGFRHSTCDFSDTERMVQLFGQVVGRLAYKPLVN
jgi:predicted GNAT family N-acyltransferase